MHFQSVLPTIDFQKTLEAFPGNHILLLPDAPTFTIVGVTDSFLKTSYRTRDQIVGKPLFDIFPDTNANQEAAGLQNLRASLNYVVDNKASHEMADQRYDIINPETGGTEVKVWTASNKPVLGAEGAIQCIIHTTEDITEKVRLQEDIALRDEKHQESENRFRTMAEHTPVLIAVGDETGNATFFNRAWTKLTGRPMQELLDFGWVDLVHPEDKEPYVNIYLGALKIKGPFTGAFRVLNPQGEYCWLLAHGVPRFDVDGRFVGYISACTDITTQISTQKQLETALEQVRLSKEAAELGTFDMDLEKGTMHWDERCRTLFGISHQGPVTYEKDFAEGLHPDDRDRILKVIDQLFIKSISNGDYDVEYRTVGAEDGVVRWVRAKGKVYFNAQEEPVRFIGSVLDITEKVMAIQKIELLVEERTKELAHANQTLQSINLELARSNQHLEEFAHAASHDMKEPIRKVLFFTNQLKTSLASRMTETEQQLFARVENATGRMGLLVDDLLEFSHVSEHPIDKEEVDLNSKVEKVLTDLELLIEQQKATIQVTKLPIVLGYKRQLQQLFQNLIGNAIKYRKPGRPPVVIISSMVVLGKEVNGHVLPEQAQEPFHLIEVKDDGIGFEPEYAEKIFQMFQRLHGKAEYPGTGVGLSIAKKVVENHAGRIWAESEPGKGATFKVLLPSK